MPTSLKILLKKTRPFGLLLTFVLLPSFCFANNDTGRQQMVEGQHLLQQAKDFEAASRENLKQSNKIRRSLLQARSQQKQKTDQQSNTTIVRNLSRELKYLQQQGGILRSQSTLSETEALQHFANGMQALWPDWVTNSKTINSKPSTLDTAILTKAHNTVIQSVHPGKATTSAPLDNLGDSNTKELMTLKPKNNSQSMILTEHDRSTFALSAKKTLLAHIEVATTALDKSKKQEHILSINQIHSWHFVLSDLSGNPITNAKIKFRGHMPGHVHGLPTQPKADQEAAPGVYLINGVKFQMQGWWVIDFEITLEEEKINDIIRFNIVL